VSLKPLIKHSDNEIRGGAILRRLCIIFVSILICAFAVLQAGMPAFAEQSRSVKECLEHPEKCKNETLPDQEKGDSPVAQGQSPFSVWDFFKMILATIFILFLIYTLLKWMNSRSRFYQQRRGLVEHLGGTSLGTNRSVQLIKVGNRILVVGVGESIHLLKEIDDENEVKEILAEYNARLDQLIEPNQWLQKIGVWFKKEQRKEQNVESFRQLLSHQLQQLSQERKKALAELEKKGTTTDE
jgi:flagellar protein FliO/FliZ